MFTEINTHAGLRHSSYILAAFSGFLLILSVWTLAPALDVGLASDDYVHLSSDQNSPWYHSSDHLYRPFRNGMLKLLRSTFGLNALPYRFLAIFLYFICTALIYRLLRLLSFSPECASVAAVLVFFSSRNEAILFWFATLQDLLYVLLVLVMLICWLSFRESNSALVWLGAVLAYGVAMGFKETAIIAPALAMVLEQLSPSSRPNPKLRYYLPYLGFLLPAVVFAGFVYWYPFGHFRLSASEASHSVYGTTSVVGTMSAVLRSLLNLLLPQEDAFALHDIGFTLSLKLALTLAVCAFLATWSRRYNLWLGMGAWVVLAVLPTSVFARTTNASYYLFLATIGVAAAIGGSLSPCFHHSHRLMRLAVGLFLGWYCVQGSRALIDHCDARRAAAMEASRTLDSIESLLPKTARSATFVGVPHHSALGKPVFNNGLRGGLITRGYRPDIQIAVNHHSQSDPEQIRLRKALDQCDGPTDVGANPVVVLSGDVGRRANACLDLVTRDQASRPHAWIQWKRPFVTVAHLPSDAAEPSH